MTTHLQIDAYLAERTATGGITRSTGQHMRGPLSVFADQVPDVASIDRGSIIAWMGSLDGLSPSTRGLYYVRVRGFTTWMLRRGLLSVDPFLDVRPPKVPRPVHRCLTGGQATALLAACREPRDRVVMILGLHTGLRRAELAALDVSDIDLAQRTILVRAGKNGHQRLLPLASEAAQVVAAYLAETGVTCGPLLRRLSQPGLGIRPGTVSRIFSDVAYRGGVKVQAWDRVGPHSMRHTFATDTYEATGDVLAVRDLLGHENLEHTQRYVRGMNVERLRPAVEGRTYLPDAA
ncbi:MAG: tyrosine-type recombinase/integrase [Acidimicrobiales bacterium]